VHLTRCIWELGLFMSYTKRNALCSIKRQKYVLILFYAVLLVLISVFLYLFPFLSGQNEYNLFELVLLGVYMGMKLSIFRKASRLVLCTHALRVSALLLLK